MRKYIYYIGFVLTIIVLILTIPYFIKICGILFFPKNVTVLQQLSLYQWVTIGFLAFSVLRCFMNKNIIWLETFSHELTHIVVALLFFRKVHSFHAEEGSGVVYTSGNNGMIVPMALAPYCLPIFTYLMLSIRCILDFHGMWIYDMLIGATLSFHTFCFIHQTGSYQTDINQYPLLFSYAYIYTARVVNFCIIIVSFFPNYNVFTSLWRYITTIIANGF